MESEKIVSGQIMSVDYEESLGKLAVLLYIKDTNEKKHMLKDYSFKPYFLLSGKNLEVLKDKIKDFKIVNETKTVSEEGNQNSSSLDENYKILDVQVVEKVVGLIDEKLLKVYVNSPNGIVKVKNEVLKKFSDEDDTNELFAFEYDLPFEKRYLLDMGLSPFTQYDFVCQNSNKDDLSKQTKQANEFDVLKTINFESIKNLRIEEPTAILGKGSELNYSLIAFDIETYVSKPDEINPRKDPILMITLVGQLNGKDFCKGLVSKKISLTKIDLGQKGFRIETKDVEFFTTEKEMINRFFSIIRDTSPDFLVGYNSDGFDLKFISERAKVLKLKMDFGFFGRELRESEGSDFFLKIPGVVNLDLYKYLRRAGGRSLNVESYSLNDVSKYLLGEEKIDLDPLDLTRYWDQNDEKMIFNFLNYCAVDSSLTYKIAKSMLPSLIEQSRVLSLLPEDTSRLSFSQLVEWFLIRKSCDWNCLIPNRPDNKEMIKRRAKRFEGAFVFQPKPGLYQRIAVFDFRSLYPTIITSHNISPETFNAKSKASKQIKVPNGDDYFSNEKQGFLSRALDEIITKRIMIKREIKDIKERDSFNFKLLYAREQTLKTIANSAYGYLGYERARWYCFGCAKAVTAFGRHYIHKVIDSANKNGFNVLYSDTDSVFIQLNEKGIDEAKRFVDSINDDLPKGMELEYEGFYKSGIFVFSKSGNEGAKKRYALIDEEKNLTIKGFETVRRNWSKLGKKLQKGVLRIILDENNIDKAIDFVMKTIDDVKKRNVDLCDLVIITKLTKKISSYSAIGPHVSAAIKMREKGISVEPGMLIKYIIAKPKNSKGRQKISDNVMLFDDASIDDYDDDYYIEKQLIPSVESIFKTLGKEINPEKSRQSSLSSF